MTPSNYIARIRELKMSSNIALNRLKVVSSNMRLASSVPSSKVREYLAHQRDVNEQLGVEITHLAKLLKVE